MASTVAASADDGRRLRGERTDVGGDVDAGFAERAPAFRIKIVADHPPAGRVQVAGESPAHDAETDDPDNAVLFFCHVFLCYVVSLLRDFKAM